VAIVEQHLISDDDDDDDDVCVYARARVVCTQCGGMGMEGWVRGASRAGMGYRPKIPTQ